MKRIVKQNQKPASNSQKTYANDLISSFAKNNSDRWTFGEITVADDVASWEASELISIFKAGVPEWVVGAIRDGNYSKDGKRYVTDKAAAMRALSCHDDIYNALKEKGLLKL